MTSEEVFIFICLRAFLDSVTDQDTVDRIKDSVSLYIYYSNMNKIMPKPNTINENINSISNSFFGSVPVFDIC